MLACKERAEPQTRTSTPSSDAAEPSRTGVFRCQGAPVVWPPRQPSAYARSLVDAPLAHDLR